MIIGSILNAVINRWRELSDLVDFIPEREVLALPIVHENGEVSDLGIASGWANTHITIVRRCVCVRLTLVHIVSS